MPVSSSHRFLYGESPLSAGKRIWVISGSHLQDWFFHNQLHGCVTLRRTLELWALEERMNLTVTLDKDGVLDFSGNSDRAAAELMYSGSLTRRPQARGQRFTPGNSTSAQTAQQQDEQTEARQAQVVEGTQQAVGGAGQALINTLKRMTQFLQSSSSNGLVIFEDLPYIYEGLSFDQNNHFAIREIKKIIQGWHGHIAAGKKVIFLSTEQSQLEEFLPKKSSPKVEWKQIGKPAEIEVMAALDRLAMRRGAVISGGKSIPKILNDQEETLDLALSRVINLLNRGEREITAGKILDMPPINEQKILEVKAELNEMVGLEDLKHKVEAIEKKARSIRKNLLEGNSIPQEESMHLVFAGPPGTGKTTAAKIVAGLYNALGLLKKSELKDIIASDILSSNREESGENMRRIINEARGGVLFIDEAHQLGDPDSMGGNEAVKVLVPLSLNYRRELVVILAGYDDRMHELFAMDQGMPRRFPEHGRIMFRDYSHAELWEIFTREICKRGFSLDPAIVPRTRNLLVKRSRRPSFGNAGGVGNLVDEILEQHQGESKVIIAEDLPPLIKRDPRMEQETFAELNSMLGIAPVKDTLRKMLATIRFKLNEEEAGTGTGEMDIHPGNMRFVGPPGTGKTTVASLMAKLLYSIGCIERPVCIETSPGALRGEHIGSAGFIVRKKVEEARDGVLFIDEAYSLAQDEHDVYGKQAVDELVRLITRPENRGTVFIVAGYKNRIDEFLTTNEGLPRRYPKEILFPNFAPVDCVHLAKKMLTNQAFTWDDSLLPRIQLLAESTIQSLGERFGNAGWVENLVKSILENHMMRAVESGITPGTPEARRILSEDIPETVAQEPASDRQQNFNQPPIAPSPWSVGLRTSCLPMPHKKTESIDLTVVLSELETTTFQIITIETDGRGSATGFFVTSDGLMATCAHVVRGARKIEVLCGLNRGPRLARPVAFDESIDLAILAVDCNTPADFLRLGDSMSLTPLAELIVYGNAHVRPGEPGRVVAAKVSRNDQNNVRDFECDGGIEEGYSGGPVIDSGTGAVVGVVSSGYGDFTKKMIRVDQLKYMLEDLGYTFQESYDMGDMADGNTGN